MIRLVVTTKDESRVVEKAERVVTIGRGHECTVQIHDEGASRKHCAIEQLPDGSFRLSDLASRNGTRLNGERITEHALKAGDVVLVGTTKIVVDALAAEPSAPAGAPPSAPAPPAVPATPAPSAAPAVPAGLRLAFVAGPNKGQTVLLSEKAVRIGRRRRDNDVAVFDSGISNRHAEIRHGPEGFVIVDAGSRNGTLLNGHRVQLSPLKAGDRIQIGHSIIEVQSGDASTAPTTQLQQPAAADLAPPVAQAAPPPSAQAVPPPAEAPAAQAAPAPPLPAAVGAEPAAAASSRRRVGLLLAAIAVAAAVVAGVFIVRTISSRRPTRPPVEDQPDEGATTTKATTGTATRPATPIRVTGSKPTTAQKALPAPGEPAAQEKQLKDALDAALQAARRAELTGDGADFDAAQKALEAARPALKGTALDREAAKALEALPTARQGAAERRRDAEAGALLAAARLHNGRREPHVARLHCRELIARFPGSPAAAEAKAMLDALNIPVPVPGGK
ncbi:MAG: FHA domain-containing protein [Planctomycetes bacterium]|nr:FHA domain-containing protein [Planctomycetota bacterium]